MSDFYCIPTNIGLTKLAAFATGGSPITITEFAVGDANGVPYLPETRVAHNTLVHECYRNAIESVLVSPFDPHVSIATINLAANVGGWRVCEIALIDDDGDIIYLANYPNNYKPTLSEGAGGELEIPVYLQASAAGSIAVVVDPNIIRASQDWVNLNFATKIALQAEVDNRSDALIALMTRLRANGIDANLAETNNATGLNLNDAQFRVASTWYFDHAINASMADTAGILTVKQAGNKVYQHEILETGREGNRVFNGTTWLPWVFQTVGTPPPNTVPLVPISSYADLNNFNTAGNFSFSASDNIFHAPPTQGSEADYELQVLVTPNSGIIQIVKNITTNTGFVRVTESGLWFYTWTLTPPIQHIVTNANIDGIRSEGVYLCTKDTNGGLPDEAGISQTSVFIVYVKNSDTLQTLVQVANHIKSVSGSNDFYVRSFIDSGLPNNNYSSWDKECVTHFLSIPHLVRISNYLDNLDGSVSGILDFEHLQNIISIATFSSQFTLRNFNLNNAFFEGLYVFTLNDNIENIPTVFTDENHFFFLVTVEITSYLDNPIGVKSNAQIIFQGHSQGITSDMFIRYQTVDDWQNHVTPPDWTLVP
jgi:hypothetical protein